jgi:hypothetical protein
MIMHVVIKQAHPSKAPLVAESLLELVRTEAARTRNSDLMPNAVTYTMLLKAWVDSRSPEAPNRLEALVQDMRSRGIPLCAV